jgi:hypothetical protein
MGKAPWPNRLYALVGCSATSVAVRAFSEMLDTPPWELLS